MVGGQMLQQVTKNCWSLHSKEAVQSPSVEMFKTYLDVVLDDLFYGSGLWYVGLD